MSENRNKLLIFLPDATTVGAFNFESTSEAGFWDALKKVTSDSDMDQDDLPVQLLYHEYEQVIFMPFPEKHYLDIQHNAFRDSVVDKIGKSSVVMLTASTVLFGTLRVAIKQGLINHEDVTIISVGFRNGAFQSIWCNIDKYARFDYYPDAIEVYGSILDKLL